MDVLNHCYFFFYYLSYLFLGWGALLRQIKFSGFDGALSSHCSTIMHILRNLNVNESQFVGNVTCFLKLVIYELSSRSNLRVTELSIPAQVTIRTIRCVPRGYEPRTKYPTIFPIRVPSTA